MNTLGAGGIGLAFNLQTKSRKEGLRVGESQARFTAFPYAANHSHATS